MKKIEVVSMIKIDGQWVNQEDIPEEEFRLLMENKCDQIMSEIGFDRIKTA